MTIDTTEATPELAHGAALGPSATAEGIAYSMLAIAHSDVQKACAQIMRHDTDEALKIIEEAATQLRYATAMLTGRIWSATTA